MKQILLLCVICLSISIAHAQATCPTEPFPDCADLTRGHICRPGEPNALLSAERVAAPAVLHLPGTLPVQHLVMVLVGGATVTNDVQAGERFVMPEPVPVQPTVTARLRAEPTTESAIVGGVESGTVLQAHALSADGEWVRVAWQNGAAWVSRSLVSGDVSALPVFDGGYGDFQAVRVALEGPCARVLLQAPRVTELPVRVNGEALVINNTVMVDSTPDGALRVSALDGGVRLPDGVRVARGFTATFEGEWSPPRPMSQPQLEAYAAFTDLPPGVVNEAVTLPLGAYIRPGE